MAVRPSLLRTLPGRAIVVGVVVKLLVFAARVGGRSVPALVAVIDTVAGLAIAAMLPSSAERVGFWVRAYS